MKFWQGFCSVFVRLMNFLVSEEFGFAIGNLTLCLIIGLLGAVVYYNKEIRQDIRYMIHKYKENKKNRETLLRPSSKDAK